MERLYATLRLHIKSEHENSRPETRRSTHKRWRFRESIEIFAFLVFLSVRLLSAAITTQDPHEKPQQLPQDLREPLDRFLGQTLLGSETDDPHLVEDVVHNPDHSAAYLAEWAHGEIENGNRSSIAELLYIALENLIPRPGETELGADAESVRAGLLRTANRLWSYCPDDEVRRLEDFLFRLFEDGEGVRSTWTQRRIAVQQRSQQPAQPVPDYVTDAMSRGVGAYVRIEGKLTRKKPPERTPPIEIEATQDDDELRDRLGELFEKLREVTDADNSKELAPLLYSVAAEAASTHEEFQDYVERLGEFGLSDLSLECTLRSMSLGVSDELVNLPQNSNFVTMALERIMSLFKLQGERTKRLREVLQSGVEHFNEGQLGRAPAILTQADRLLVTSQLTSAHEQRLRS